MRKIVVLGSGLSGYHAARQLESSLASRRRVKLTVISERPHLLFSPLLYSVATGELDLPHVVVDLRDEYASTTELVLDRVARIEPAARLVHLEEGEPIAYDYLLIATGSVVALDEHPHWLDHLLTFKDARDAVAIRTHLEERFAAAMDVIDDPQALERILKVIVIGAGATGVELTAEIASAVRERLEGLPLAVRQAFQIIVLEAGEDILPRLGTDMRTVAREQLNTLGVDIRTGSVVTDVGPGKITLDDGTSLEAGTIIFCGGVRAPVVLARSGFDIDELGRVHVDETMLVKGHRRIYAIGASAVLDDPAPIEADVARQQAEIAAQNLLAELSGRSRKTFRHEPTGNLITLGKDNAALSIRGVAVEGKAAWLMYRLFHTAMMPRALKKARLLKDWIAARTTGTKKRPDARMLVGAPEVADPGADPQG
jgi:NADH:ubiquinone reductase (H+-translocating)